MVNLVISSRHINYNIPNNFVVNANIGYCDNLIMIYNDKCEIKTPTIKYDKLFVIINFVGFGIEELIKNEISHHLFDDSNMFIKFNTTWDDIFEKINAEIYEKYV